MVLVVSTVARRPDENGSVLGLGHMDKRQPVGLRKDDLLPTPRPLRPNRAPSMNACCAMSLGPSTFLPSSSGPQEAE